MSPRPRRPVLAAALLPAAALVLAGCGKSGGAGSSPTPAPSTVTVSSAPRTSSPAPAPSPSTTGAAQVRAAAAAQIAKLIKAAPSGGVSLAALNTKTGATYSAGAKSGMWTASAYKLFVLETLLYRTGGDLSSSEQSQSVPMIEQSDNVAGYALWEDAGRNSGLREYAEKLGMTHTDADGTDPTFTTMSGPDGVKLLQALVDTDSPLSADSRSYALHLMHNVESDQRWGVGQAADAGTDFANKNGWLSIDNSNGPGENDGGLWAVNSLGVITVKGQQVLMAVFTRHDRDFDSGKALVAQLAKLTAATVG